VPPKRAVISSGVMEGHKLSGVNPRYPIIAIASHVQGTVVLAATISRTGTIENLRLLSGSPILSVAAEDAVRTWRYRPYMLNGEPVEVETTVNVIFHLATE
jgi:protein TonB